MKIMKSLMLAFALAGLAWAAGFADEDTREARFLNEVRPGAGVNPGEAATLFNYLEEAYTETGKFRIWTKKNISLKLSREAAKGAVDCMDTSCLVKQAQCKGVDAELSKRGDRYSLSIKILSVEGTTIRSKTITDLDMENDRNLLVLAKQIYLLFEEGKPLEESRFQKKSKTAAAPGFLDEDYRESRFLGSVKTLSGLSAGEGSTLAVYLEQAYTEKGKFQLWTIRNIREKLQREAMKGIDDCPDTSCLSKQAQCVGIDSQLTKVKDKVTLSVNMISVQGMTVKSKVVPDIDLDDDGSMKLLAQALYAFFEENKPFDESKFKRKRTRDDSKAPVVAGSSECDLIISLPPAFIKQYGLTNLPIRVGSVSRNAPILNNRVILEKLPGGVSDLVIDFEQGRHRFTFSNQGLFLVRGGIVNLPEEGAGDIPLVAQQVKVDLTLTANQPGHDVSLNGEVVGQTPVWKGLIPLGTNRLSIRGTGILGVETNIMTRGYDPISLTIPLTRVAPVQIRVTNRVQQASVDAQIFLDGILVSENGVCQRLVNEGNHKVLIKKEGYDPVEDQWRVTDQPLNKIYDLDYRYGWLRLSVHPGPARVILGGAVFENVNNITLSRIPVGERTLVIEKQDYSRVEETLIFSSNHMVRRSINLEHTPEYFRRLRVQDLTGLKNDVVARRRDATVGMIWKFGAALGFAVTGALLNTAADENYARSRASYSSYQAATLTSAATAARNTTLDQMAAFDVLSTLGDTAYLAGGVFTIVGSFDLFRLQAANTEIKEMESKIKTAEMGLTPSFSKDQASLQLNLRF